LIAERISPEDRRLRVFPVRSLQRIFHPALPIKADMRARCPPVYDQGDLGSCTANALVAAMQVITPSFFGSRLFLYYNQRAKDGDGDPQQDAGSTLSQGVRVLASQGLCAESAWPYDISRFADKPSDAAYVEGQKHRELRHAHLLPTTTQMMACLAAGYPFVVGIMVYESFESAAVAATGKVPMPGPKEPCLGGHAVLVVGYDVRAKTFLVRNSWGPAWGDGGYFHLPFDYLTTNMASDIWHLY
jgi:C1A family cysteine protease